MQENYLATIYGSLLMIFYMDLSGNYNETVYEPLVKAMNSDEYETWAQHFYTDKELCI